MAMLLLHAGSDFDIQVGCNQKGAGQSLYVRLIVLHRLENIDNSNHSRDFLEGARKELLNYEMLICN